MKTIKTIIATALLFSLVVPTSSYCASLNEDALLQLHSGVSADINASVAPQAKAGMMVYNATDKKIYYHNGTQWVGIDTVRVLPKTSSYTLQGSDYNAVLTFDSASDVTLTIPAGLPVGFNVSIYQIGAGKVHIVGSDTTVKNRLSRFKTAGKDAGVGIVSTASNVYHVTGDLKR